MKITISTLDGEWNKGTTTCETIGEIDSILRKYGSFLYKKNNGQNCLVLKYGIATITEGDD